MTGQYIVFFLLMKSFLKIVVTLKFLLMFAYPYITLGYGHKYYHSSFVFLPADVCFQLISNDIQLSLSVFTQLSPYAKSKVSSHRSRILMERNAKAPVYTVHLVINPQPPVTACLPFWYKNRRIVCGHRSCGTGAELANEIFIEAQRFYLHNQVT